jgi:hypothetical protein
MNSWCTVSLDSHFFSSVWWMQKIWSVGDMLCWNPRWWFPIISSTLGDRNQIKLYMKLIAVIVQDNCYSQFYHPSCDPYNNRLLPLIKQFFLIPNSINELFIADSKLSSSCLKQFCRNLIITWQFMLSSTLQFAISYSKQLGPGPDSSAVCSSICLTSLILCTCNNLRKVVISPI